MLAKIWEFLKTVAQVKFLKTVNREYMDSVCTCVAILSWDPLQTPKHSLLEFWGMFGF